MIPNILTYYDVVKALEDFAASHGGSASPAMIRRAILAGWKEITDRDWSCLIADGRVYLQAAVEHTAVYDHTGGTVERQLTTTGTWPTDAVDWSIRFASGVVCDVETRVSDTVVRLDATMNPRQDVASGTVTAYPRWYVLPSDFVSMSRPNEESRWTLGEPMDLASLMRLARYQGEVGNITYHAVGSPPDLYGAMALFIYPAATTSQTLDFTYRRRPRQLRWAGTEAATCAGTIAVTAGSAAVTGTSTSFDSSMVGSILRIGSSATAQPTGLDGPNPWVEERAISAVTNATHLTLDASIVTTRSGMKCTITDPIDLDAVLHVAFQRCCEKHLSQIRDLNGKDETVAAYKDALFNAKTADSRHREPRIAGPQAQYYSQFPAYRPRPQS